MERKRKESPPRAKAACLLGLIVELVGVFAAVLPMAPSGRLKEMATRLQYAYLEIMDRGAWRGSTPRSHKE